jgi:ATP-binding cassette subfamily D (ALD) protein 3
VKTLQKMRIDRRMNPRSAVGNGDCIEFKDVKVQTPTKVTLVEKLNFKLEKGDSILITGHNGAGKSSIFRCLGGLWSVPEGAITKPGSADSGLHQDVFYLPQKPYVVVAFSLHV